MMAPKGIEMGLVLVFVVMLWGGATAQTSCMNAIVGLSPCLNFVTGNSSTASSSCCSMLSSIVQTQPQCLCSLINGGAAALGININQSLALTLPGVCNVQTPPLNQCNAANGPTTSAATPASSPVGSPADSSDDTPDVPTTPSESNIPSGGGSKTVPSTGGTTSDGSNIKAPLHLVLFVLFVASCASAATRI